MQHIRIVIVNSYGNANLGSIARVMKNFGLNDLFLVQTRCDPASDEAQRMAVHAQNVLDHAVCVSSMEEALEGCSRVVATTAQARKNNEIPENTEKALKWLSQTPKSNYAALLFGAEDRGLSNEELSWAQRWICLPGHKDYPTFNLAQAVGITLYELQRQTLSVQQEHIPDVAEVSLPELQSGLEHLSAMLLEIGYLHPHTQKKRIEKLRKILYHATLNPNELAMLRGIFSQVQWALGQGKSKN